MPKVFKSKEIKKYMPWVAGALALVIIACVILLVILQSNNKGKNSREYIALNDQNEYLEGLTDNDSITLALEENADTTLNLEVARSEKKRQVGLMHRTSLKPSSGMFFIFNDENLRTFWMKNTVISLDIIFLSEDLTVVKIHQNTTPIQVTEVYSSGVRAKYAIETNSSWCQEHNLDVGDKLIIVK